jgi:GH43 family beta-xylosidase
MLKYSFTIILLCLFIDINAQKTEFLTNPILQNGADPWMVTDGETFHYCYVRKDTIFLKSVKRISELVNANERIIWIPIK